MTKRARPHPGRKRRAGGWTLLMLAALVAGAWFASRWWGAKYVASDWAVLIERGSLVFQTLPRGNAYPSAVRGWGRRFASPAQAAWEWWYGWNDSPSWSGTARGLYWYLASPSQTDYMIVLWPLPLLLTAAGLPLLLSGSAARRRAKAGHCPHCGYDRRGLPADPAALCPECGKP